ncbi:DNA-directed RNA polymerase I subunit rpa43 [Cryptomeria japonica]|uniref:DNA-directed RNA polymerase I subunit rpa43 n=1 Tax=Cryptomeria japonica TaxID=3369 RepID=UPI0027DA3948|nr:DNA-directed RNA polymerase I subunit rpa43 [Cryptomeria japonica]
MEGLSVAKATLSAFLHPSRSADVEEGVLQLLSSLLLRYNEEFDGVVLAYFDIKVCDWTPKILSGLHPYLSLKLKAKLLLFSPKPGMLLEGTVNKVEKDYMGAIVLGIFNAAIAFSDIHEDFSYQDNVNGTPFWASTSNNHVIRLGSKIKFVVKSVQEESFLDICGSLKPPNTGCVNWLLSSLENIPALDSERKKQKNEKKRERIIENMGDEVKDDSPSRKELRADYINESEYKQKSKSKRKDRDTEIRDGSKDNKEFSAEHFYERDHKHKSKRKLNADIGAKDGGMVSNEFPADHFHEREHKHKSKRKRDAGDAIM